jgi:hypothetical protein
MFFFNYIGYCGSLTTPPCTESVIWTILPDIVYISQYQVNIEENKINLKGHGVGSNLSYPNNDKNRMYDTQISPLPGMSVILYDFLEINFIVN